MAINQNVIELLNTHEGALADQCISDIRRIFAVMIGRDDVLKMPLIVDPFDTFCECVTVIIGLAGSCRGLITIHMPEHMALDFTSRKLGVEIAEVNGSVHTAIGELAQLFAGSLRNQLAAHGNDIRLSIPSILTGREYSVSNSVLDESLTILCDIDDEWLMVNLALAHNGGGQ